MTRKKDSFPRTVSEMCRVLARWKNRYGSKYNCFSDVNHGMAFTATSGNRPKKLKNKKQILCYKYKKDGHYSDECDIEDSGKAGNI